MSDAQPEVTYVSDEEMQAGLAMTRPYVVCLLFQGPAFHDDESRPIMREHGRRNFGLRADGVLNIVCRVIDDSELCGVGVFNGSLEEVDRIMQTDPGVAASVFRYELHPCGSFAGDALS